MLEVTSQDVERAKRFLGSFMWKGAPVFNRVELDSVLDAADFGEKIFTEGDVLKLAYLAEEKHDYSKMVERKPVFNMSDEPSYLTRESPDKPVDVRALVLAKGNHGPACAVACCVVARPEMDFSGAFAEGLNYYTRHVDYSPQELGAA